MCSQVQRREGGSVGYFGAKLIQTTPTKQDLDLGTFRLFNRLGEQGWRSGESTRLPSMWPWFDSRS